MTFLRKKREAKEYMMMERRKVNEKP